MYMGGVDEDSINHTEVQVMNERTAGTVKHFRAARP